MNAKHTPTKAEALERLIALDGLLNMHERAQAAAVPCQLNGVARKFNMGTIDCGTAVCLHGSAKHSPWFKERGYCEDIRFTDWFSYAPNGFFGDYTQKVGVIYGDGGGLRTYGKGLEAVSISEVRAKLRALILEAGGQEAIETCNRNKKRGDKLRMGLPTAQGDV